MFVVVLIAIAVGALRVLRGTRVDPGLFVSARAALVLLVATMVWLNDNPLFGAQPETVLAATFLGMLAAIPPILQETGSRLSVS